MLLDTITSYVTLIHLIVKLTAWLQYSLYLTKRNKVEGVGKIHHNEKKSCGQKFSLTTIISELVSNDKVETFLALRRISICYFVVPFPKTNKILGLVWLQWIYIILYTIRASPKLLNANSQRYLSILRLCQSYASAVFLFHKEVLNFRNWSKLIRIGESTHTIQRGASSVISRYHIWRH